MSSHWEGLPLVIDFKEINVRLDEARLGLVVREGRGADSSFLIHRSALYDLTGGSGHARFSFN